MHDERIAPPGHVPAFDTDGERPAGATAGGGSTAEAGFRATLAALRPLIGRGGAAATASSLPLERMATHGDPPTVASCTMLETDPAIPVPLDASPVLAGFLDGIQRSRVVGHVEGSPIVLATVAAVIRERADRRMRTWREPRVRHLVLAARSHLGEAAWATLEATGVDPIDVSDGNALPLHPLSVRARALELVAEERESQERRLAAAWCREEARWLWIDGGISGNLAVAESSSAFGVVKSHTTLYGDASTLRSTLALTLGARGPLFLVQHRARRAVASWYLRVHAADGGDPLHGLVRVEVAPPATLFAPGDRERTHPDPDAVHAMTARANALSAWILAERAPIALPDPRWSTLTYGVYACEQFLKALIGAA